MELAGGSLAASLQACGLLVPSCGRPGWQWVLWVGAGPVALAGVLHAQSWKHCWGDSGKGVAGCCGHPLGVLRRRC